MEQIGSIRLTAFLLIAVLVALCSGTNSRTPASPVAPRQALLDPTGAGASSSAAAAFAPIRQSGEEAVCGSFLPPRLVTVAGNSEGESTFSVDVVVGPDGVVDSVLILDGTKPAVQSKIAERVSRWIYKPALCNGVPIASEGRIQIRGE